jgi:hypothetical protein
MKFAEGSRRATLFQYRLSEVGHIPWRAGCVEMLATVAKTNIFSLE